MPIYLFELRNGEKSKHDPSRKKIESQKKLRNSINIFKREKEVLSGNVIDIEIRRSDGFKRIIEDNQDIIDIPDTITTISIDFTNARDYTNIIKKLKKGYHSADTLLIIVLTGKGPVQSYADRFTRKLARSSHEFKENLLVVLKALNNSPYFCNFEK